MTELEMQTCFEIQIDFHPNNHFPLLIDFEMFCLFTIENIRVRSLKSCPIQPLFHTMLTSYLSPHPHFVLSIINSQKYSTKHQNSA